jgi:hypothetical protein
MFWSISFLSFNAQRRSQWFSDSCANDFRAQFFGYLREMRAVIGTKETVCWNDSNQPSRKMPKGDSENAPTFE